MARSVEFWRGVAGRLVCADCGTSEWSIQRCDHETRGKGECSECGARMVYYNRSRAQPNAVAGAVTLDSLLPKEDYITTGASEWLGGPFAEGVK